MNKPIHVLMTGAGAPGAAGIIKCLLQEPTIRLSIADANNHAVGRYLHSPFFKIPKATATSFVEEVSAVCKQENVQVVLPLVTKELVPLSHNKHRFNEEGIRILVSSPEAINIANNKATCYEFLRMNKIAVPQFYLAKTTEDFIHAAFSLGHPQEAFCFKPSIANGSRGFRVVSDSISEGDQLFLQKPYNTYITYAHAVKILSTYAFPPLVVSEYLPGEEYSVDCVAQHGEAKLVVPRLRTRMINGISVQGTFIYDEDIIEYCRDIIQVIGLHGNIGIQLKRSKGGQPLLLEINPRVQGTIVAGLGAGVNLPLLAIKQELGIPTTPDEWQVKWGTSFSRFWTEVFYEGC